MDLLYQLRYSVQILPFHLTSLFVVMLVAQGSERVQLPLIINYLEQCMALHLLQCNCRCVTSNFFYTDDSRRLGLM